MGAIPHMLAFGSPVIACQNFSTSDPGHRRVGVPSNPLMGLIAARPPLRPSTHAHVAYHANLRTAAFV